jgi:hypothetical protein
MGIVERINRLLTWLVRFYKAARKVTDVTKEERMVFRDTEIERIDLDDIDSVYKMIVQGLCGEIYYKELYEKLSSEEKTLLSSLLNKAKMDSLNFAQFNELLLLLNQNRIGEAFFKFLFDKKERITLEDLRQGIIRFRGYAMLCFGNFRFAYKQLIQKNEKELEEALEPYRKSTTKVQKGFVDRLPKVIDIKPIKKENTWYNGYIAIKKHEKEANLLGKLLKEPLQRAKYPSLTEYDLNLLNKLYEDVAKDMIRIKEKSLQNTDIYLTWDHMDVYIATSMRHKWEFEETFDFINKVFKIDPLPKLNLRYFDPTQSQCKNRIDKALIEGLMLKRALCTIYMAQEVDTMGKDSELSATLAQRKPVIAYVPSINIEEHAKKIYNFPLEFFRLRFFILLAEGIFYDEKCEEKLKQFKPDFLETFNAFNKKLEEYRKDQPFSLWDEREEKFKQENDKLFSKVCKILATAEHYSYEKRALTLKEIHPLSIQVDLASGVANGVLVVRNKEDCAKLLYAILTNCMTFTIEHVGNELEGYVTVLREDISQCPFRVVTDYEKLTNSFWNFYLTSEY